MFHFHNWPHWLQVLISVPVGLALWFVTIFWIPGHRWTKREKILVAGFYAVLVIGLIIAGFAGLL